MELAMRQTWIDFFSTERQRLVGYVRSLIDDAAEKGKVVPHLAALEVFQGEDQAGFFAAYAYQALRNRVVDYLRRRKKNDSIDAGAGEEGGRALSEILADLRYDAAQESERKEINRDLYEAINSLDDYDRDIFVATEFEGLTFSELSEMWDVPIGTLLSRKSRAVKKLQKELIKIDSDHYTELLKKG